MPQLLYVHLQLEPPQRAENYTKNARKGERRHDSCDERALEALLATGHPIIELIIAHRKLSKLNSTYLEPLPAAAVRPTAAPSSTLLRIHAALHGTRTGTGRLSSSDPNVQNIPSAGGGAATESLALLVGDGRGGSGVSIRAAFRPSDTPPPGDSAASRAAFAHVMSAAAAVPAASGVMRPLPPPCQSRCSVLISVDYAQVKNSTRVCVCGRSDG